jgi:hypothetical protein
MKYTESSIITIFHVANVNRFFSYLTFTFLFFENTPFLSHFPLWVSQVESVFLSNII